MTLNQNHNAEYWRKHLQLESHVEGGSFRETYRAALKLPTSVLPATFKGERNASTGIYFLLEYGDFSAFHRIAADEMWHFYDGYALTIYEIKPGGELVVHQLGKQVHLGERPQLVISAGSWFASRVEVTNGYTLVGCTVAPGFDFADFELGDRAELQKAYPAHAGIIAALTR
ncbi:cupin domain-containing protein [Chitinophaga sp.]|uniref:cupin domain-containing protein n=1 Tax=Chitinophaga sp. TaxID=1869181 RepID=UPI0031D218D9